MEHMQECGHFGLCKKRIVSTHGDGIAKCANTKLQTAMHYATVQ